MFYFVLGDLTPEQKQFLEKLFKRHNVAFYNTAKDLLHTDDDAEEAVARTFLKIIDHIERIFHIPPAKRLRYCVVIVKNESVNLLRERSKAACFSQTFAEDITLSPDPPDRTEALSEQEEAVEYLHAALSRLSEEEWWLVNYRFIQEKSYAEIAQLLNINEAAARQRGRRVLKKLRELYEKEENRNHAEHV